MPKVLVIDDDRTVTRLVEKSLDEKDLEVESAENAESGLAAIQSAAPDVVLLDIMLPDGSGIEIAKEIRDFDPKLPVIFVTASEDSAIAIEAMKLGAYDYVTKPLAMDQIQDLVERGLNVRRMMQAPVRMNEAEDDGGEADVLIGHSKEILEVYKQIGRVAAQDVSVLIRGDSGTGKELIARALYQHSHRNDRCFLAVNCAALTDTLLESELFGHEKGAFTGADRRHIGKFEQCDGGTLFLDEVGDMSPLTQTKVLRLLQEQEFERVGGRETIRVDVRIISATNRDLEQMIDDGEFRLDLYHRLNAFEIHLPSLRQRGEDIELLLDHFLTRFNRLLHKNITGISSDAMQLLKQYPWPGNIRELQSVLRKGMLMATGPVLVPEYFINELGTESGDSGAAATGSEHDFGSFITQQEASGSTDLYAESLEWMERILLTHVLQRHGGNQTKAADELGITRGSLRHKIKTLGIVINQVVTADDED